MEQMSSEAPGRSREVLNHTNIVFLSTMPDYLAPIGDADDTPTILAKTLLAIYQFNDNIKSVAPRVVPFYRLTLVQYI